MSKFAGRRAGPAIGVGAALVAAVVAAAVYLWGGDPSGPAPEVPEAQAPAPPKVAADAPAAPQGAGNGAPEQAPPPPDSPALDTFRLDPGGQMLVAGRAVPGARVAVTVDDARLGITEADGAGKFVAFLDLPPSDAVRVLGLEMLLEDGGVIRAPDEVLIAPTPVPGPAPAAVAGQDGAAETPDPATGSVVSELATSAPDAPEAPTVLLSDATGVRVLQAPAGPGPQVMSQVALDAISYSETGTVQLAGRASSPDARVRIYLDNRAITTAPVDASGAWRSALPEVDTGIYTLRVDEVDAGGKVTSRLETPFKREDVAILAPQDSSPRPPRMSVVTVQPGSTLWAISRESYGEGVLYMRIFEANRERIRDPDLIYPGQVFDLPQ